MNFVIMSGHLMQDPEQRQSQDGKTYMTGRIGVNQGKEADGSYKPSIIFDFSCFGYDVNIMSMAKKGDLVTVAGRLEERTNVSQTNGQTYVNKKIVANSVSLNVKPQPAMQQPAMQQPNVTPYNMPAQPTMQQSVMAQPNVTPYNTPYNTTGYQDPFRS